MRYCFVIILLGLMPWGTYAQNRTSISQVLEALRREHSMFVTYDATIDLNVQYKGEDLSQKPLKEALRLLFAGTDIQFKIKKRTIILIQKKVKKHNPQYFVIKGTIIGEGDEPVINASVYDETTQYGVLTDEHGRYAMHVKAGRHVLKVSWMGQTAAITEIELNRNKTHNFTLRNNIDLPEVTVIGDMNSILSTTQTGKRTLSANDINTEFSLLSSPDLLKTLQKTSGVTNGVELSSGLFVHGGNNDENLYLLDGSPLYQTNHSLGLFSAFNTDVIKNVDFYKSGFPARYSGRVSSITDVRTKDGNLYETKGCYSIGLIDGRLQLEGPIKKGKTSYNLAIRRSWIDLLLKPTFALINKSKGEGEKYTFDYAFYDINGKITHHWGKGNTAWLSVYSGKDGYQIHDKSTWSQYITDSNNKFNWGNINVTLAGNFVTENSLSTTLALIGTYSHSLHNSDEDDTFHYNDEIIQRFSLDIKKNKTKIYDLGGKVDSHWRISSIHDIRFGGSIIHHDFKPQTSIQSFYYGDPSDEVDTTNVETRSKTHSNEFNLYLEDEWTPSSKLSIGVGCSYTLVNVKGRNYHHVDPRLALKYQIGQRSALKLSYTHMSQNVHRIASSFLELPTDFWVPTTDNVRPTISQQIAGGYYMQWNSFWKTTIEGFVKNTDHLLQYRNWMGLQPSAAEWEKNVTEGQGHSYGIEFDVTYRSKRISSTLAYTLSWSKRNFPQLYKGWFYDQFDNRHKVDISGRWRLSNRLSLYAAWIYHSGNRITLPIAYALQPQMPGESNTMKADYIYGKPNNICLPAYHRLDIGCNFYRKTKRGREGIWNVSLYNAYCHFNTMYVQIRQHDDSSFSTKSKGFVPIIPSVSYTLKF